MTASAPAEQTRWKYIHTRATDANAIQMRPLSSGDKRKKGVRRGERRVFPADMLENPSQGVLKSVALWLHKFLELKMLSGLRILVCLFFYVY